ncbi:MAG: Fic family protein [Balneolaceae bacterium]|nr:Fic family protein [Balneolaceae bacterium]
MGLKIDPAELQTTNDLLKDFAADPNLTAEEVYRTSWSRFNILEQVPFHEILHKKWILRVIRRPIYAVLPQAFHKFIYDGLFTFAGRYRSKNDPHDGNIYFGQQHAQRRKPKFTGDHPDNIKEGILEAVRFLKRNPKNPLYNSARFYQKFVNVHPFYDANGRIGRLIASMYLADHDLVLSWSEFDSKSKFIKKLNRCHLNPNADNFGYLVNYMNQFTLTFDDLES